MTGKWRQMGWDCVAMFIIGVLSLGMLGGGGGLISETKLN